MPISKIYQETLRDIATNDAGDVATVVLTFPSISTQLYTKKRERRLLPLPASRDKVCGE